MYRFILSAALVTLLIQAPVFANPSVEAQLGELTKVVYELRQMVVAQQQEINFLKEAQKVSPVSIEKREVPQTQPSAAARGKWNPDIGVIADTVFKYDSPKTDDGADRLSVRELELVMGSYVDPYSRMDVNIAFSDLEDVHLQEAYLTRFGLPFETTARIGRSKPKVGKALLYHRDILDTADYPLVIQKFFGEDGLNKTGVDLTKPLNLPFESAHEISWGIIEGGNGEGGTAFGDSRRRPTIYSHLKNFWDISEVTNFELGASHMIGSQDNDSGMETNIAALDGTFIHLYGPDQRIKWQNELFMLNQSESSDKTRFGAYSLFDVRFHKQWSAGTRFDYAQFVNNSVNSFGGTGVGVGAYITFFQTEFARWRLQYNHINSTDGKDDNQIFIQGIFAIGEHKHKLT